MSTTPADESLLQIYQRLGINAEKVGSYLPKVEAFWRDHEPWLKAAGYILRPRYQSEWVPSWFSDPSKIDIFCEDYKSPISAPTMDAIRESDGLQVMLKWVDILDDPTEIAIASLFSSEPLASNPRNHCVPIHEILQVPEDNNRAVLVMPFFLKYDHPPFVSLGEILDFFHQIIEGLQFMHQQNVSHCDVKRGNIMSDTLRLYQVPPHPMNVDQDYSAKGKPKLYSNRMQKSVKHYLVDLGLSHMYPRGVPRLQVPGYGGNHTVPEFQNNATSLCDPFAVDVYCMGDFIRTRFRQGESSSPAFHGLEFMDGLVADMVQDDPKKRPTMDEVMDRFSQIVGSLSKWKLLSRASTVDEATNERIIKNTRYWLNLPAKA